MNFQLTIPAGLGWDESLESLKVFNSNFQFNYLSPDSDCDLDYTPNSSKKKNINYAMTNSFGFGGHNAVLIYKKFEI